MKKVWGGTKDAYPPLSEQTKEKNLSSWLITTQLMKETKREGAERKSLTWGGGGVSGVCLSVFLVLVVSPHQNLNQKRSLSQMKAKCPLNLSFSSPS